MHDVRGESLGVVPGRARRVPQVIGDALYDALTCLSYGAAKINVSDVSTNSARLLRGVITRGCSYFVDEL